MSARWSQPKLRNQPRIVTLYSGGNEYRVIYGDLHAETVSPERLAELEKALPQ